MDTYFQGELSDCVYYGTELKRAENKWIVILKVSDINKAVGLKGIRIDVMKVAILNKFDNDKMSFDILLVMIDCEGISSDAQAKLFQSKLDTGVHLKKLVLLY